MNKFILYVFTLICLSFGILRESGAQESSPAVPFFLNVVLPDADTLRYSSGRYRIAASTSPDAQAFINGIQARVYPTGAFVGLVEIKQGENNVSLSAVSSSGDTLRREFVVIRPDPPQSSPSDALVIERTMMEPSSDVWLNTGDILEVRFKGSPGYEATFTIPGILSGEPMRELTPAEAGGLRGVYIGRYQVKEDDETRDVQIEYKLRKSFWSSEHATSQARVWLIPKNFPRVGEIRGERRYINAGLGTDRLGGARLQYIDAGTKVVITGRKGDQYRVRFSETMTVWIPVQFIALLPEETPLPRSLTGSVLVTGTRTTDFVTLGLDERLPYLSRQLVNPPRIEVDVFGATSNTNWITHHRVAEGIQTVSWQQVGEDHFRLIIHLANDFHWGFRVGYGAGNSLRIHVRRPPTISSPDNPLEGISILVDAGHGGTNVGALGATGAVEKEITLATSLELRDILVSRGAQVSMTRESDADLSMADRSGMALQINPVFLVSIHANSIGLSSNPMQIYGTSTYYKHIGYQPLANLMYDKMLELGLGEFGIVGSFNFTLNSFTEFPNVLVEIAFMSHPEDEMLLLNPLFRRQTAEKIADGLEEYLRKTVSMVIETEDEEKTENAE